MEDSIRSLGMELGNRALKRNWAGVHELLAPWLRNKVSDDDVRVFFEDGYREILQQSGIQELHYPEYPEPEVDGNDFTNATELREPIEFEQNKVRPVPPEVTDENMKYWMSMQLQCSEEQMEKLGLDYLAEVWMAIVETQEGLRVGYWSQGAY